MQNLLIFHLNAHNELLINLPQAKPDIGEHQKVVSFSYFEGSTYDKFKRSYFDGISLNLQSIKDRFPSKKFRMRLYYQLEEGSLSLKKLLDLSRQEPRLDICNIEKIPVLGNMRYSTEN